MQTFQRVLDQSSFVLKQNPELIFPQIYNRAQWKAEKNDLLKNRLLEEKNNYQRPWLRLLTRPIESSFLMRSLTSHSSLVNACAFSSDGRHILSVSSDETLKIWDAESGKDISTLKGHTGTVTACAFSPDGRYFVSAVNISASIVSASANVVSGGIVSAGSEGALKLWDLESGKEIVTFKGHTESVNACAFSPDGRRIVSASQDWTLKLWDVESVKEISTLKGYTGSVKACAFSPDGRHIVSVGSDETLLIWNAESGNINVIKGFLNIVEGRRLYSNYAGACVFSPDGRYIVVSTGSDTTLRLLNAESGKEIAILKGHNSFVNACAFSPDGRHIVSASSDETLKLWDAESGKEITTLKGHTGSVNTCAFSPNDKYIVLGDSLGQVLSLSVENIKIFPVIITPYYCSGALFFQCPYCLRINQIEESSLDQEVNCSECDQKIKLNKFMVVRPQ